MALKEQIYADFISAYKAKNFEKKNFLGVLKGAIETNEGKNIESTDENVLKLIKILEKGLNETLNSKKNLNLDYSAQETELAYLTPYLPTQIGEGEVRELIKIIITNNDNKNVGYLMGLFNKENKDKWFDNKLVNTIITEELALI